MFWKPVKRGTSVSQSRIIWSRKVPYQTTIYLTLFFYHWGDSEGKEMFCIVWFCISASCTILLSRRIQCAILWRICEGTMPGGHGKFWRQDASHAYPPFEGGSDGSEPGKQSNAVANILEPLLKVMQRNQSSASCFCFSASSCSFLYTSECENPPGF